MGTTVSKEQKKRLYVTRGAKICSTCRKYCRLYPDKHVLVFNTQQPYEKNFKNVVFTKTLRFIFFEKSAEYTIWVFDSGTFFNRGDGGDINWDFGGPNIERDDKHLTFKSASTKDDDTKQQQSDTINVETDEPQCKRGTNVNKCAYIQRIINALIYYESLENNENKKNNKNELVEYCTTLYKSLLNDWIHILEQHTNDTDKIFNLMGKEYDYIAKACNNINCRRLLRHYRDREGDETKDEIKDDQDFVFWRDILDSIHCQFCHLYDVGMRVKVDDIEEIEDDEDINDTFSTICQTVNEKQKAFNDHRAGIKNNKFLLGVNVTQEDTHEDDTFMDGLYDFMKNQANMKHTQIKQLQSMFDAEQYDSDAIIEDISQVNCQDSNIHQYDAKCYDLVKKYAVYNKLYSNTFSIGYRFYYWKWYAEERQVLGNAFGYNVNDHSGYKPHELFIAKKYATLKDECLNNTIHSLDTNQFETATKKAYKYINTEKAKDTIARGHDELQYEIENYSSLTHQHLLALILYTDWSTLCTAFTGTFRANKQYEAISSIIARNREYANWSKLLREMVEIYGINSTGNHGAYLTGPFFSGMSFILVIPEFNIRLCGPTSTSTEMAVATRFAGKQGILIQLNNTGDSYSDHLTALGCSWISTYPDEQEWLFCGGQFRICVESVRIIETGENFKLFFAALFYLDCMINGAAQLDRGAIVSNKSRYKMLEMLIKHKIGASTNALKQYINDTFAAFANHKTKLVINFDYMQCYDKYINLIMYTKFSQDFEEKKDDGGGHKSSLLKPKTFTKHNLLKPIIFTLFPNVSDIMIYTASYTANDLFDEENEEYSFNLLLFLDVISSSLLFAKNNLQITIQADHQLKYKKHKTDENTVEIKWANDSWISLLYVSDEWKNIKQKFNQHNLQITYKQIGGTVDAADIFTISKIV